EVLGLRHRQLDDREANAADGQGIEQAAVRLERRMIRVGAVRLDDGHDRARRDEPREVVDVAVRVVARDALPEPEDLADAETVAQQALDVDARQLGVPIRVQEALLRRQQRALAVDLDRAALEHDARLRVPRHAERLGHLSPDLAVEVERRVLAAPGVVVEIDGEPRLLRRPARHEDRAVIAGPSIVRREPVQAQALGSDGLGEQLADMALVIGAEHVDINGLALGERSDELDHRGLDAFEHARPAIAIVRPREPRRFVRCPFGGLAVAASARRIGMVGGQGVSRRSVEPRRSCCARPTQRARIIRPRFADRYTRAPRHSYHAAMTTATPKRRRNAGRAWIAALGLVCAFATAPLAAQTISSGTLLVASPQLTD